MSSIEVVSGIEDYFIPAGAGVNFPVNSRELAARVAIDEQGRAVLKQLYLQSKPWL